MSLSGRDISVSYAGRPVLAGVSLDVPAGRIIGLHGYSGAGKTTLARILAGQLRPDAGEVRVDGKPLAHGTYLPVQLVQQHPERAIDPRWRLRTAVRGIDQATLSAMGVRAEWLQRYPLEVSGGQLQRVSIARALDARTRYLVADEITTMMDALLQADIWRGLVSEVRRRDMGMLVISHDHHLLGHVCDEVVALKDL